MGLLLLSALRHSVGQTVAEAAGKPRIRDSQFVSNDLAHGFVPKTLFGATAASSFAKHSPTSSGV
jgi:hypothetical protein